jgi:hypothetical protein
MMLIQEIMMTVLSHMRRDSSDVLLASAVCLLASKMLALTTETTLRMAI